jgi:hypothetical protein
MLTVINSIEKKIQNSQVASTKKSKYRGIDELSLNQCRIFSFMVEPTLETEKVISASMKAKEEQENPVPFLEHEIECPRCHDSMMLCSDFDNLYYVCEECDFCLYTIKKSAS